MTALVNDEDSYGECGMGYFCHLCVRGWVLAQRSMALYIR